jgi:predicted HAD superfamily Cof-like phosphohydrolase
MILLKLQRHYIKNHRFKNTNKNENHTKSSDKLYGLSDGVAALIYNYGLLTLICIQGDTFFKKNISVHQNAFR